MIVIISLVVDNYEEIFFILRYVDWVKRIVNYVVVNEDFNVKVIWELWEEVEKLRE